MCLLLSTAQLPLACYRPSLLTQYTEESDWTPFDLLSRLVREWEGAAKLPDDIAKNTRQVVVRPGRSLLYLEDHLYK